MDLRPIGKSGILVSPLALGCWPITGMTSLNVTEADSMATLAACPDLGINFFDTAYCYGLAGESETMIARALGHVRDEIVIATKGGIHWDDDGNRCQDASPEELRRQCEESLRRLNTDRVELLYLHAPDPTVPITDSAGALKELLDEGKARCIGVSNMTVRQLDAFEAICPISAVQPYYNMLQRELEYNVLPWCMDRQVSVMCYWPLMKGLLAGKLDRDHEFKPGDGRAKYPMFQGDEWQQNQDFVDDLRAIADDADKTVAQLVLNWTIHRPGITAALCGAKRPDQVRENAGALDWQLTDDQRTMISAALERRGTPVTAGAV
jgi:aryl-alcohol dehydrogenase-like predicted oxidoreductase